MADIVLEFGVHENGSKKKVARFTIRNFPEYAISLTAGDEIGFDLAESVEFFYATVSRKVLIGDKIFVICIPHTFSSLEELAEMLERFKSFFSDDLEVD
jgi:hypothetical protein